MSQKINKNNNQAAWSGLVLVVVTFMLIGVYFFRMDSTELVTDNVDPNLVVYKSKVAQAAEGMDGMMKYSNADYGFNLFYPAQSQISNQSSIEGDLKIFTVTVEKGSDQVIINNMPIEMEGAIRSSINVDDEYDTEVDQKQAVRIDGSSVKDGSQVSMVIIENNDNLISIQGTGQNFEDIVSYFEII